jgi:hypothetical protein
MKKNVGGADKAARFVAGIALVLVGLFAPIGAGAQTASFVVAAVALITGITGL